MTAKKLKFFIMKKEEDICELMAISKNDATWFIIPEEDRNIKKHHVLLKSKIIQNVIKNIKNIGNYRNIDSSPNEELKSYYFDEEENVCMKGNYLEETENKDDIINVNYLEKKEEELQLKDVKLKFILEDFRKEPSGDEWMTQFENECRRFNIHNKFNKIQILKLYVQEYGMEWYLANLKKLSDQDWSSWKKSFSKTFQYEEWTYIRKAIE